jgi:NADPH:quinone reductase-like Zn-dependent oxidoreductase
MYTFDCTLIKKRREMRAAVVEKQGSVPTVRDVPEPEVGDGIELATVRMAALNPVDQMVAGGHFPGAPPAPFVVGREGIAELADGRRVHFIVPSLADGSIAERAPYSPQSAVPVPDGLSDGLALAAGVAGIAAWLPLTLQADLQPGESVLVLGASGAVGSIAMQAARLLGASRVVGAARDTAAVERTGAADAVVSLDGPDVAGDLLAAADGGFDVVVDPLGGDALAAAVGATAEGARLVNLGYIAGPETTLTLRELLGRRLIGHSGRFVSEEVKSAAVEAVLGHLAKGEIKIEVEEFPLAEIGAAWERQAQSPHGKVVVKI